MNIVVNAVIETDEASIAAMRDAVLAMQAASRAEAGCLDYTFSVELADPNVMRITERWETMAALAEHFGAPHMAEFQQSMAKHPPKRVDAKFYEVKEVTPPGR
jgi:quinol monooxygenase YgiN